MAITFTKQIGNKAQIAVWEITESEQQLIELLTGEGDEWKEEIEEISLSSSPAHRVERLAVIALVQSLFDEPVHIGHHENGSPYIENNSTHISISHTKGLAAVIIAPQQEVGIDVESIERDFSAVQKKALGSREVEELSDDGQQRNTQLALYWCAKEAIYKRMGVSGVDFSKDIHIERFSVKEEGEIDAVFTYPIEDEDIAEESRQKERTEKELTLQYEFLNNYILVWTVE